MYQKSIIRNIAQTVQYQCLVMIALDACFEVRYTYLLSMEDIRSWRDHEHLSKRLVVAIEQKGAAADHGSGSTTKSILNVVED